MSPSVCGACLRKAAPPFPAERRSSQKDPPVTRHRACRPRRWLRRRVTLRRGQRRPGHLFFDRVIPEPVFPWLERLHDGMARFVEMRRCMATWRGIAAADMAAQRASAKVKPPTARGKTFDATRARRRDGGVDIDVHGVDVPEAGRVYRDIKRWRARGEPGPRSAGTVALWRERAAPMLRRRPALRIDTRARPAGPAPPTTAIFTRTCSSCGSSCARRPASSGSIRAI